MTSILDAWNRAFHAPSSGHRVAAVRILFGLYLLGYFGGRLPHVPLLFSRDGVYVPYWLPDYAPSPLVAQLIFGFTLLGCAALTLGLCTALVAPLLLLSFLYHYFLQIGVSQSSFDRLIAIYLLILCFADSGRVWGLDARRPGVTPSVWGERLLAAQTVLLYAGSGLWKLMNPAWHSGTLLYSNMQGMWATPLAFMLVRALPSPATWTRLSWTIIVFELALAPLLLVRRTRPVGVLLGAAFHLYNCVVLVIPEFVICIVSYPVFVDPQTLQRVGERIQLLGRWHRLVRKPGR